jgi:RNA-binding protein YlmH
MYQLIKILLLLKVKDLARLQERFLPSMDSIVSLALRLSREKDHTAYKKRCVDVNFELKNPLIFSLMKVIGFP